MSSKAMPSDLILVTGATGLLGNNIVRLLVAAGRPVRVLLRGTASDRPLAGLVVERVEGDVTDAESVNRACDSVRYIIHSAGLVQIGSSQLELHRAINVGGTRNVARAARAAGARMIHVSSTDALGVRRDGHLADEETPLHPVGRCAYAITKREAETAVLDEAAQGLDAVIVNPGFMLGPWDWKPSSGRMLLEVARGRGRFAPRGSFTLGDARDVAAAIVAALERGRCGERYILGGYAMKYIEAWRLFAQVTGGRRPLFAPGPMILWVAGKLGDLSTLLTSREPDVNSAAIAAAWLPKRFSSAKAQRELGFVNRPLRETVEETWRWFRENGYARRELGARESGS